MVHDLLTHRMATSKLYVSEEMLRRAEEDTFALCVRYHFQVALLTVACIVPLHALKTTISSTRSVSGISLCISEKANQIRQGFVRDGQLLEEQSIGKM